MNICGRLALASLLLSCALSTPSRAGISPYFRADYGGNQLKMEEGNRHIEQVETSFTEAGLPASFEPVGPGAGPSGSVGLWLFPGLRVGASYSYLRSVRHNRLHVPGQVFYGDDLEFRMTELGGEVAVRVVRLAGLTLGGNIARGRGELIEGLTIQDSFSSYFEDLAAQRTRTTYGGFIGLDQTNEKGLAGFIRVGYQSRDMGSMPSHAVMSDGVTTVESDGTTIPLDYSGFYVKLGLGFDLVR